MKNNLSRIFPLALMAIAFTFTAIAATAQYTEKMLINFVGANYGFDPQALLRDGSGNLYSIVTSPSNTNCDNGGCGQIVKFVPNGIGGYTENIIHVLAGGAEGYYPVNIVLDAQGNIFGSNYYGGINGAACKIGCGTIFELSPLPAGGYKFSVLYSFTDRNDGHNPLLQLVDSSGNLYGSVFGGIKGSGLLFELSPSTTGTWTKKDIYAFDGTTSNEASSLQYIDAAGNIYATGQAGGTVNEDQCIGGCGQIVEYSPSTSSTWTYSVLYSFNGAPDGAVPTNLIPDGAGNFWGITFTGGTGTASRCQTLPAGCGTLFELSPNASGGWTETVQHSFNFTLDGEYPVDIKTDGAGNFYTSVYLGGVGGDGVVLKFSLASNGIWQYTTLHSFAGGRGGSLPYHLAVDPSGNVFGTVFQGGSTNNGGIFELSPPAAERR